MKMRTLVQEMIVLLLPDSNTVPMNHKANTQLGTASPRMNSK